MTRRIAIGLGFSALIGAAGLIFSTLHASAPGAEAQATPASAPAAALGAERSATQARPRCELTVGQAAAWSVSVSSRVELDARALGARAEAALPPSTTTFEGRLQVEVLEASAEEAVLLARWREVDAQTVKQASEIGSPFLLKVDARCAIRDYARHNATGLWSARAQQAAAAELWFAVPSSEREEARGRNGFGAFTAVLAMAGERVQRRIASFEEVWGGGASGLQIGESLVTVTLGEGPWFSSLEGRQEVRGAGLPSAKTSSSATRAPVSPDAFAAASRELSHYTWGDLFAHRLSPPEAQRGPAFTAADRAAHEELRSVSFEGAMDRFASVLSATDNIEQQWRDLALYLEARPMEVARLAKALKHQVLPQKAAEAAFLAMGKARVPEAREALRHLAGDGKASPVDRWRSAVALAGRPDVSVTHARELISHSSQALSSADKPAVFYGRNALLAVTMMAGLSKDPEIVSEARRAVGPWLSSGKESDVKLAFEAIGNIGDVSDLSLIDQWSRHADVDIRAVVPQGLRRMPLNEVGEFMLSWIRRETAPDVKRELWHVLDRQLLDEQKTLSEAFAVEAIKDLRAQHPVTTRQTLIKLLSPLVSTSIEARAALLAQVPIEFERRSGLYSSLAGVLPARQVEAALAGQLAVEPVSAPEPEPPQLTTPELRLGGLR